jgi:hypothetical protein
VSCVGGLFGREPQEQVSRQRLDELSAAQDNDETRMSALRALIAFADDQFYMQGSIRTSSGDPEKDRLMQEAREILARWVNVETIGEALSDPDSNVQCGRCYAGRLPGALPGLRADAAPVRSPCPWRRPAPTLRRCHNRVGCREKK